MSQLRLDLTDRTFADLLDIGRAQIPRFTPQWTDHNLHDPGMTLLDVLAWNAEAQIYSLGRMRRDERIAYAALFGIEPFGPTPASGIIWPNPPTPQQPTSPWGTGLIVERNAEARTTSPDAPLFRTTQEILLTGAKLVAVRTRLANGAVIDQTAANRRGGAAFQPFGNDPGPKDRLELEFELPDGHGLVPDRPDESAAARQARGLPLCLALGIRAPTVNAPAVDASPRLVARLVAGQSPYTLPIVEDSSDGFMHTGALLLDVSQVESIEGGKFVIEILPVASGIGRPPRVARIEPNVLTILQNEDVKNELHTAMGIVGQVIPLAVAGLRYGSNAPPLVLSVLEAGRYVAWKPTRDLSTAGPDDRVFVLDPDRAEISFGNKVNGRLPPPGATALLEYSACAGRAGNLPRNQRWTCRGVAGVFGMNLDATSGGADALDLARMQHDARQVVRNKRALVTNADVTKEALALPLLDVMRAHIIERDPRASRTPALPGTRTMVVMRARVGAAGTDEGFESARWLFAVQRALAARMPLGERLRVIAPRYVRIRVRARLVIDPMRSPEAVEKAARVELERRLSLTPAQSLSGWPFNRDVTAVQVSAWLSKVDGVTRVEQCELYRDDDATASSEIAITGAELPDLDLDEHAITAVRGQQGRQR